MTSVRLPVIVLMAWTLTACASSGRSEDPLALPDEFTTYFRGDLAPHRTVLSAPLERVDREVAGAYEYMGLPVALASDPEARIYITPTLQLRGPLYEGERNSDYIDCGTGATGARADQYDLRFAAYTKLSPGEEDGRTVVETLLSGFASSGDIRGGDMPCRGTGKLEESIARILRARATTR